MSERAVSSTVGTVLLAAAVLVAVAVPATFVFDGFADDGDAPTVDVTGDLTTESVTLTNAGGEAVQAAELSVVVTAGGESTRVTPDAGGVLAPGERWTHGIDANLSAGERVTVYVTHEPTGKRLYEASVVVAPAESENGAPSVTVSAADDSLAPADATTLSATGTDPDGDDLTYDWRLVGGGTAASLASTSGPSVRLTARGVVDPRTVVAEVTVSDGEATATARVTLSVEPRDEAPLVTAFELTSEEDGELTVRLRANRRLPTLRVSVSRSRWWRDDRTRTLTRGDFRRTWSGRGVTYEATLTGLPEGYYVGRLSNAADATGTPVERHPVDAARVSGNRDPQVWWFDASDGPGSSKPRVTVWAWDPDDWGADAQARVTVVDDGAVVGEQTVALSENPAFFVARVSAPRSKGRSGDGTYAVHLVVTDGDGGRVERTRTVEQVGHGHPDDWDTWDPFDPWPFDGWRGGGDERDRDR